MCSVRASQTPALAFWPPSSSTRTALSCLNTLRHCAPPSPFSLLSRQVGSCPRLSSNHRSSLRPHTPTPGHSPLFGNRSENPALTKWRRFLVASAASMSPSMNEHRHRRTLLSSKEPHDETSEQPENDVASMDAESASAQDSQSSGARWADFPGLSDRTKKALMNTFKYEHMTAVQEQVLKYAVSEKDIDLLVRAKTGTGKTLAFLAAGLERVMKSPPAKNKFAMLILSPTRELATQIAGEASKLGRSHDINVVNVIGGDSKTRQLREIDRSGTNAIMVATPGRLIDLLQSNSLVSHKLGEVQVLIFDEADQLLDMGFREDMTRIESYLPKNGRQTFMFSATISKEIKQISEKVLRPRLSKHIDTVPPNEVATHMRIRQSAIVSPFSLQMPLIVDIIRKHRESTENPKIIVFLNTTKLVDYTTKVFSALPGGMLGDGKVSGVSTGDRSKRARPNLEIFQIQSRIESSRRSKISANFRNASDAILFTSDVSARGVDYPNVTLVIQVGAASNTEQYIHRIGRTGRAGKDGEGVLILSPYEEKFLKSVRRVAPVKDENRYDPIVISRETEVVEAVKRACSQMGNKAAQDCYYTYIGYSLGQCDELQLSKATVIKAGEEFGKGFLGMPSEPTMPKSLATRLGLLRVPGIKLSTFTEDSFDEGERGGRGGYAQNRGSHTYGFARGAHSPHDRQFQPRSFERGPREGRNGFSNAGGHRKRSFYEN